MCTLTLHVCRVCFHKMNQSPGGLVGQSIPGLGTPLEYHCVCVCGGGGGVRVYGYGWVCGGVSVMGVGVCVRCMCFQFPPI